MPDFPANVSFCQIQGKLVTSELNEGDADGKPNMVPLSGVTITFTPEKKIQKLTNITASPVPITYKPAATSFTTDVDGLLRGADGEDFGWLIATDDPDWNPVNWTYLVEFENKILPDAHTAAPGGSIIDIATIMNNVGSVGDQQTPAEAAAAAAAASAIAAAASAASINVGVPGGVAELDSGGLVINADGSHPGGGSGGGVGSFADLDDVSLLAKDFNSETLTTAAQMRNVISAGTSNLALGSTNVTAYAGNLGVGLAATVAGLTTAINDTNVDVNAVEANVATLVTDVNTLENNFSDLAPLADPPFTGIPTAPTPANGVDSTQIATTEFVQNLIAIVAQAASDAYDLANAGIDSTELSFALSQYITAAQHAASQANNIFGIMYNGSSWGTSSDRPVTNQMILARGGPAAPPWLDTDIRGDFWVGVLP